MDQKKVGLPFLNPLNCLSMLASTSEMTSGHLDLFLHLTPKKQLGKQFKTILTAKIYQILPQAQSRSYLRLATWLLIQRLTSKVPSVTAIAAVWSSSPTLLGDPTWPTLSQVLRIARGAWIWHRINPNIWAWILSISPLRHDWSEMFWWRFAWACRNTQSSHSASQIIRLIFNDVWSKPWPRHPTAELFEADWLSPNAHPPTENENFWCELWLWCLYLCNNRRGMSHFRPTSSPCLALQFSPPRHLFPRFHLAPHLLPRFSSIKVHQGHQQWKRNLWTIAM